MAKVLVLSKRSTLEQREEFFRERLKRGLLSQDQFQRLQKAHEDHHGTLSRFLELLQQQGVSYTSLAMGDMVGPVKDYSIVFTVGGDGTVLAAARSLDHAGPIIVGIRSSPLSVGYLCRFADATLLQAIDMLESASRQASTVCRLRASVQRALTGDVVQTDPVLNEILFSNASPAATTRYAMTIGDRREHHRCSGVWVSTPVGSTAAIFAAGGERVDYTRRDFQYLVREPFGHPGEEYRLLRGFFEPEKERVSIENHCESAILALDGAHGCLSIDYGDRIHFERAESLRIVLPESHDPR